MNDTTYTYNPEASIVLAKNPHVVAVRPPEEYSVNAHDLSVKVNRLENVELEHKRLFDSIQSVRNYILEYAEENDEVTDELAEIAELLGIELDRQVDIEMTIVYTATISVPLGQKIEDHDFDVTINYNGDGTALYDDYTIQEFDNGTY